jgi:hypothetical protein
MTQAPLTQFPFVGGSYLARSRNFDAQRTVNLYPEMSGSGNSKSIACLIGTPGTRFTFSAGGGAGIVVRGMIRFSETISIVVTSNRVAKVTYAGGIFTSLLIGTIPNLSTPVSMASNGLKIMLVTGPDGFEIDPVLGTVTQIVDPDFHGADVVWFIDGYFVFNWPGTQKYQITDLYSTAIQPLKFASAEGSPDLLISLIVINNEILLLGEASAEFHADSGNTDFPFEPIRGAFIEQGCAAKFSVAKMTDGNGVGTAFWLTRNESGQGMVVRNVGYQPQRISDHALELAVQGYSVISDAIAYTYQQEGHNFYVLNFPTAAATWAYDTSTELWCERGYTPVDVFTGIPTGAATQAHPGICHMFFGGKNLVGSRLDACAYELDLDYFYDDVPQTNGTVQGPIYRIRQCPHLSSGDSWQIFDRIWFDMETGVGLVTAGTGNDPKLILEWSDDGGSSFPNSMLVPIGKLGQRKARAVARRLGKSRDRVFRVTLAEPVKCVFNGAGCNVRVAA